MRRLLGAAIAGLLALPLLGEEKPAPPVFDPSKIQRYRLIEGACEVGFDGTSTLDNFSGSTRSVSGFLDLGLDTLEKHAVATIRIDATTLDTKNKDRDMEMHRKHLETAKFPAITWTMEKAEDVVWEAPGRKGRSLMKGTLDLHGVKNALGIPVEGEVQDGVLRVKGEIRFKMTHFGIAPPSKLLVIRVGKEVRVWFDIQARLEGDAPSPPAP